MLAEAVDEEEEVRICHAVLHGHSGSWCGTAAFRLECSS